MTLERTNLFISSHSWTTYTKFDTCCQRYIATGKILYRCTSTFSALNYCSGIFSIPSTIYTKWCAQTFPPIFGLFAIFDRHISKFVTPSSDENENHVLPTEKMWKPHENRPINRDTIHVRSMHPSNEQRAGIGACQKINIQTPYFRTYCRRA